jgi:NADH:ubiquinone oxidoreductase subunit D
MESHVMAALAKLRCLLIEKVGMVASVDLMADQAVLHHGRMLKHERPSFLCMAFVAEFVYRIGFEHRLDIKCPHGIVAIRTFHLSFVNRMMRLLIDLSPYYFMAGIANIGFWSL